MVLLEEDAGDVKYENTADLTINGKTFENMSVYGDKKAPERRTLIPGTDARTAVYGRLPEKAVVEWQGRRYPARLSFRTRRGGQVVPVYEWFIGVKSRRGLKDQ